MDTGLIQALLIGLLSGMGLLAGAAFAVFVPLSHSRIASVVAVGAGLLLAAASLELIDKAAMDASPIAAAVGFCLGAAAFSLVNLALRRWGAERRKRCGECVRQPSEQEVAGSGLAIAIGSIPDNVPESMVLGFAVQAGEDLFTALPLVIAFALANAVEGLTSASGMLQARRSRRYVFTIWGFAALAAALSAAVGWMIYTGEETHRAWLQAFAAGALVALVLETLAPEAVHKMAPCAGLLGAIGFALYLALVG